MNIKDILRENPFVLGPMAGITDSVFRCICREYGCGLLFSEMISSKGLYYKDAKTEELLKIYPQEKPVAFQIFGSDPEIMAYAASVLKERKNDFIDINMGCPVPKVVKSGDGSALLKTPDLVGRIVKAVVKSAEKPVTVKIRIGWDENSINVLEIAKIIEDAGAAAITIHSRTREQFYSGKADWSYIKKVKEILDIPVIGSGDVFSGKEAVRMIEETGCDGVMIARGARGNPWIFNEALWHMGITDKLINVDLSERVNTAIKHFLLLVEEKGEYVAIREMRKHIGWYFKDIPHATEIRRVINTLEKKDEIIMLLEKYLHKAQN
ncbi:MAG: tRNA dihydrouridine synthase DusB [Clostridiales bacterium]|nr:tRNA dihydrouridine synthase DusB [Clostridiales bacterium]